MEETARTERIGANRAVFALFIAAFLPLASACSVGMAAAGKEDPNVRSIDIGSTMLEIERELGKPKTSRLLDDGGRESVYEYELGNEPSTGRAVLHGGLDILTFGIWEVVGTPIEATMGDQYELTVIYGPDDKARSLTTKKLTKESKSDGPTKTD